MHKFIFNGTISSLIFCNAFLAYFLVCFAPLALLLSFEDSAEQKCEENVDKAVTADPSNPEAHQLKASFLLSKEKTEVSIVY